MNQPLEFTGSKGGSIEKHIRIPAKIMDLLDEKRSKTESDNALFLRFLELGLMVESVTSVVQMAEQTAAVVAGDLDIFEQKIEQLEQLVLMRFSAFEAAVSSLQNQTKESEQNTRERLIKVIEFANQLGAKK